MKSRGLKVIGLIVLGAVAGISVNSWLESRRENFDRNVDLAYAAAIAALRVGPPEQNPFVKENKAYPAFETECGVTSMYMLRSLSGNKEQQIKAFDLIGFAPAFDSYEIAIYRLAVKSGPAYFVGCLMKEGVDWKGTRILFKL
jgi:hypothetical protein